MHFVGKILIAFFTIIHIGIVVVILTGWLFKEISYLYGACLIGTALSWLILKRCVLVDVEHYLRTFFNLKTEHQDKSFTATFVNRLFGKPILSDKLVVVLGVLIMSVSIPHWLYTIFIESLK